jgi:hypothetical protein
MISQAEGYRIAGEHYQVEGRTKPEALLQNIGESTDMVFSTQEEMLKYIAQRKQQIDNLRVFLSSDITVDYGPPDDTETAVIPVTLTVHLTDGAAFLPIPYAMFNSNDGFMAGAVFILPNISGYLQDMQITSIYNAYPGKDNTLQWPNPNFKLITEWSGFRRGRFLLGAEGEISRFNEQVVDRGETFLTAQSLLLNGEVRGAYQITGAITTTTVLSITGRPVTDITELMDQDYYRYDPLRFAMQLSDTLSYSKIDWTGNFRQGITGNFTLSYGLNMPYYADTWHSFGMQSDIAGFYVFNNFLNPSARLSFLYYGPQNPLLKMGERIRGIIDTELAGNIGIFVNTGVQIKLFRTAQTEIHLIPTADFAFVYAGDGRPDPSETGFAVGGELLIMDDRLRAFPIKLGLGIDLRPKFGDNIARRIEIDMNFKLFF